MALYNEDEGSAIGHKRRLAQSLVYASSLSAKSISPQLTKATHFELASTVLYDELIRQPVCVAGKVNIGSRVGGMLEASEYKFAPIAQLPQIHHGWNEAKAQVVEYAFTYGFNSLLKNDRG